MATDLTSRTNLMLTRFWGGMERRQCLQITQRISDTGMSREALGTKEFFQAIILTREEAGKLAKDLKNFSKMKENETYG